MSLQVFCPLAVREPMIGCLLIVSVVTTDRLVGAVVFSVVTTRLIGW